ncbi:helix-turn-helix domain-containing protein [Rhizobium sp. SL86]|nr:helix-turn-helix domain-containing protein [Rhizobium sp. SL86]
MATPLISAGAAARALDVAPQAVRRIVQKFGFRAMMVRRRFRA